MEVSVTITYDLTTQTIAMATDPEHVSTMELLGIIETAKTLIFEQLLDNVETAGEDPEDDGA